MTRAIVRAGLAAVFLLLPAQAVLGGGPPPEQACAVAGLEAARHLAGASSACHSRAFRKGQPVEAACLEEARERFADAVRKVDRKHSCGAAGDWARIGARVETYVTSIVGAVTGDGTRPAQRCAAAKLAATTDGATAELICHAKALRGGRPVEPRCLDGAAERFFRTVARLEEEDECSTTGDAAALEAQTRAFVGDLVRPGLPTTVRDESRATRATIGAAGGVLNAAAADGTTYSLNVPVGALAGTETITLTPVVSILSPPLTGSLVAAVHFAPEGLQFATSATLTITVPPGVALTRVVGFVYDGDGQNAQLRPIERTGAVATLAISHFSGGGLTLASLDNFAALLNALPPAVSPSQAAHLVEVAASFEQDAPGLCATTPLCEQVTQQATQLAQNSLTGNLAQVCAAGQSFLAAHEPFLAEQTIHPMMDLIAALQALGVDPSFDCVTAVFQGVASQTEAAALADPKESLLEFLLQLSIEGQQIGIPVDTVFGALKGALQNVLILGTQLCQVDPAVGEEVLERSCVLTDAQMTGLGDGLLLQFNDALKQCGLVVDPAVVTTLKAGEQQTFSATVMYPQPTTPSVSWTADPSMLGTITAQGQFTAGSVGGAGHVQASTSVPPLKAKCSAPGISFPAKIGKAAVTVADIAVTVSPGAVITHPGEQTLFTATVTGAIDTSVTWSATGGGISGAGLYTAPSVLGTHEVKAQSVASTAKTATVTVTVKPKPYTITNLGPGAAHGLNSSGDVVGQEIVNGQLRAWLRQNGTKTDLGTMGGTGAGALAINDESQIVGFSVIGGSPRAFLWKNGIVTDLGTLGGSTSVPADINTTGAVVGSSGTAANDGSHAFLWQNGAMTDVGGFGGPAWATGINSAGQVVGGSYLANELDVRAFLWNGNLNSLGTLGGTFSSAEAINDVGQVVGCSSLAGDAQSRAFVWQNGGMTSLGTLGGATDGCALDINAAGQVVGYVQFPSGSLRAFVWQDGTMTDLNDLLPPSSGVVLSAALRINDAGQIIARDDAVGYFLLTP